MVMLMMVIMIMITGNEFDDDDDGKKFYGDDESNDYDECNKEDFNNNHDITLMNITMTMLLTAIAMRVAKKKMIVLLTSRFITKMGMSTQNSRKMMMKNGSRG